MKEVDLVVSVLKPDPAARGYDDAHVRLAIACDAAYVRLAQANMEIAELKRKNERAECLEGTERLRQDAVRRLEMCHEECNRFRQERDAARAEAKRLADERDGHLAVLETSRKDGISLRAALKHYADQSNWGAVCWDHHKADYRDTEWLGREDGWRRARAALGGEEGER